MKIIMNKKFFFLIGTLLLTSQLSYAHPPRAIDLQYDLENNLLLMDITHITRSRVTHYIRKIEVTNNNEPPIVKYFHQQIPPLHFITEIPLTAEEGDLIKVKAHSWEGGSTEVTLEITEEILNAEITPRRTLSRSIPTIPRDKSKLKDPIPNDPAISIPTIPKDRSKLRPAVPTDPSISVPAVTTDPSKIKAAFSRDPSIAKPTIPTDPSKIKPALPINKNYY